MKHSENNQIKRIGFFVDKNYYTSLHQVVGQAISPKRLEEHLEDALEEDFGLETNLLIDKHLITYRQATSLTASKTITQEALEEQYIDDLFIARYYELTSKLIQENQKEFKEVYLVNSFTLKVLSEVIKKELNAVCLFVQSDQYAELIYTLKSLGIQVLIYQVETAKSELSLNENLSELADAVLTLTLEEKSVKAEAQTTTATIFHHSEDDNSSKLEDLMGKIKDAPKIPVEERVIATVHTTSVKEETIVENKPEEEPELVEGEEYIGEIANIVKPKGFAFIKRSPANVFLYYGNMLDVEQFYELEVGTKVIYQIQKAAGGRIQAVNVFPVED